MKYIWIIMLIIIEIIWVIFSTKDFIYTAKRFKAEYVMDICDKCYIAIEKFIFDLAKAGDENE